MTRLLLLFRTRLALRTTAIILLIVALLGGLFLGIAVQLRAANVKQTQQIRLEELLTTVERTAQIACFLADERMAQEVTQGLLSNNIVNAVTIRASDGTVLAAGRTGPRLAETTLSPVVREVSSPFEPGVNVCRMTVEPDQDEVDLKVAQASIFLGAALLLQLLGIGVCVILVVARYVTRPITGISHRLSELEVETGQKLKAPRSNRDDEIGALVASVNVMIDNLVASLGQERRLRVEREVEERRYRAIFDNVEAGLFELDGQGLMRSANPAFRRLFGIERQRDLDADPIAFASLAPGDASIETASGRERDEKREGQREYLCEVTQEGGSRWISLLVKPLETGRLQGVAHDVTERKHAAETAAQMAVTDPLTGLGNRRGFDHRLAVMARHYRLYPSRHHSLMMLDFDHFKQINDTHGHHAGDRVLRHVARTLSGLLRQRDYIARLGGDEFVVLLEGCERHDEVETLIQRFLACLETPIPLEDGAGTEIRLGVSLGIATLGIDTDSPQQAVEMADRAMYAAKRAGRNTWRFYATEMAKT
ncbi:diguanylate cyclase domain-containing protein [Salinicola aestuarinus]|uniref:diguanylate cyclase domain-containing protein n=1 Tax=Salinicola aestuarinus TaxID=1949082 RepID=UPI00165EE1E3|nr:diguanylate cyclase [Salinicola aestuarinus]